MGDRLPALRDFTLPLQLLAYSLHSVAHAVLTEGNTALPLALFLDLFHALVCVCTLQHRDGPLTNCVCVLVLLGLMWVGGGGTTQDA